MCFTFINSQEVYELSMQVRKPRHEKHLQLKSTGCTLLCVLGVGDTWVAGGTWIREQRGGGWGPRRPPRPQCPLWPAGSPRKAIQKGRVLISTWAPAFSSLGL